MITFRRAVRENIGLIIGLAGPSGGGKTYTAMRLAAGLSGGKPFAFIDTEAGRAKHYADMFTFDHADLSAPFKPSAYAEAIAAADDAKYPVIVVDSCSHEHAGEGGLLDWHETELDRMAQGDWKRRESCNMAAWIKPKMEHKQFVSRLLQVRAHLILCFRAEQKVEVVRGDDGKMKIEPKKIASGFSDWIPICEKNMLYELTASFLLTPDSPGVPKPIKLAGAVRPFVDLKKPLDEKVGEKLSYWAKGNVEPRSVPMHTHGVAVGTTYEVGATEAPFNPETCPPADGVPDETYQQFLEYVGDDPDRTKVGKAMKKKMSISEMSAVPPAKRKAVMLSIQDEAKRQGVPFSAWVTE